MKFQQFSLVIHFIQDEKSVEKIEISLSEMLWPQEGTNVSQSITNPLLLIVRLEVWPFKDYGDPLF